MNKNEYPDISGIFDIDESSLPKELIEKEAENNRKSRNRQSILISQDKEKQFEKETEKKKKAELKRLRKKDEQRKKIKRTGTLVLTGVLVVLVAVFSLKGFISAKRAPVVNLCTAETGEISVSYMAKALMLLSDTGSLYAAFVDNDFDLHSIVTGQSAIITSADERSFTGQIQAIRSQEPGSEITARIQAMLPNGIYSSASNYVIYVSPSQSITGINENDTVSVEVISDYATNALLIPAEALFSDDNGDFVWQYSSFSHKVKKVYVSTGIKNGSYTQVTEGLKKNASVVYPADSENITLSDRQLVKVTQNRQ